MTISQRLQSAIEAEIETQKRGLDSLIGVSSVVVEVFFKPDGADDVNLKPQTKGKVSSRITTMPARAG